MKRFIDLRHTYEDTGVNFAWWDTVINCFDMHGGQGGFKDWADFELFYNGDDLERYWQLIPEWVYPFYYEHSSCECSVCHVQFDCPECKAVEKREDRS